MLGKIVNCGLYWKKMRQFLAIDLLGSIVCNVNYKFIFRYLNCYLDFSFLQDLLAHQATSHQRCCGKNRMVNQWMCGPAVRQSQEYCK